MKTNPILLLLRYKRVQKSDDRVMDYEKLILFKRLFYHCHFNFMENEKKTMRNEPLQI